MTLSVIIVSYNTKDLTLKTLESAWDNAQSSTKLKGKTQFIIVDNYSTDKSSLAIKKFIQQKKTSSIKVISNQQNLGFAKANNQGIKHAKGIYILLLNSDTFVQPHALETLVNSFERFPQDNAQAVLSSNQGQINKLGILAATLLNADGTIQPQGGDLPNLWSIFFHMSLLDDLPIIGKFLPSTQHTGLRQVESLKYQTADTRLIPKGWVAATAILIRKTVFAEIGLLDENIFMYGEDIEFCLRAKKHHFDIAIDPQAKITHLGSASSNPINALKGEFNSYLYIWSKHKPFWQIILLKLILKFGAGLRILFFGTITLNKQKAKLYQEIFDNL